MPDCFSKSEVTDFMNFMKLPDGTSVVSDDMICTYSVACRCSAFRLLRMCLRNICIPFCYPLI